MKFAKKRELEQQIKELRREAEAFVRARAEELKVGSGLPIEVLLQMLQAGKCRCTAALDIFETERKDKAIADAQRPTAAAR
jgi:hypothetical protein